MQPENQNNYWQPGDQPATPDTNSAPTPVQPAPQSPATQPQAAQPAPAPQTPPAPATDPSVDAIGSDDVAADTSEPEVDDTAAVRWQAKEYIHQEKNGLWFIIFGIVIVALMAAAILLMKSWSFAALLVVIAVVIIVFARRPPRVMSYSISQKGLHIGDTLHAFSDFKSFGVIRDGEEYSVMLIPTKRFLPGVTVYFPEESGEQIVDMLGARLPMQELHLDWLDRLVRKLRL
jgi:hypothetical protein